MSVPRVKRVVAIAWTAPRTWVAGEVVTAALLNTHLRDNIKVGRGYQRVVRTAGNLTLNSTSWANSSTTLDLTVAASTGDVLEASPWFTANDEASIITFNFTCVASGAGFSTRTANNTFTGWFANANIYTNITGGVSRTAASADISGGNVIVRLRHRTNSPANKSIAAATNQPLMIHVRNNGPHVAP